MVIAEIQERQLSALLIILLRLTQMERQLSALLIILLRLTQTQG